VVGGAMLATSGALVLLGVIPQGGAVQGIATIPEIIWEAFLGLYLLFKDFKPSALAALTTRSTGQVDSSPAVPSPIAVATQAGVA